MKLYVDLDETDHLDQDDPDLAFRIKELLSVVLYLPSKVQTVTLIVGNHVPPVVCGVLNCLSNMRQ